MSVLFSLIYRTLWLLLTHAGLTATLEGRQVRAWLEQHAPDTFGRREQ